MPGVGGAGLGVLCPETTPDASPEWKRRETRKGWPEYVAEIGKTPIGHEGHRGAGRKQTIPQSVSRNWRRRRRRAGLLLVAPLLLLLLVLLRFVGRRTQPTSDIVAGGRVACDRSEGERVAQEGNAEEGARVAEEGSAEEGERVAHEGNAEEGERVAQEGNAEEGERVAQEGNAEDDKGTGDQKDDVDASKAKVLTER